MRAFSAIQSDLPGRRRESRYTHNAQQIADAGAAGAKRLEFGRY